MLMDSLSKDTDPIVAYATYLATAEAGIGGFMHSTLYQSFSYIADELQSRFDISTSIIVTLMVLVVVLKMVLAIGIVIATPYIPSSKIEKYVACFAKNTSAIGSRNATAPSKAYLAYKNLLSPIFLICLFVTASFLLVIKNSPHWFLLGVVRPIALGFVFFFITQSIPVDRCVSFFRKKASREFCTILERVINRIQTP
jgi:hypothetical protein